MATAEVVAGRRTRPAPRGGTETILLVEDEPAVRDLVRTVLERRGYRVLEAASGGGAALLAGGTRGRVDLLLTDLVMPDGVSGHELAQRLRADRPRTEGHLHQRLQRGDRPEGVRAVQRRGLSREALLRRRAAGGHAPTSGRMSGGRWVARTSVFAALPVGYEPPLIDPGSPRLAGTIALATSRIEGRIEASPQSG